MTWMLIPIIIALILTQYLMYISVAKFLKNRFSIIEYFLILHLSAGSGLLTYSSIEARANNFVVGTISCVVFIIILAGGIWGQTTAIRNKSFPGFIGVIVGCVTPIVFVGTLPLLSAMYDASNWVGAISVLAFLVLFFFAHLRLNSSR